MLFSSEINDQESDYECEESDYECGSGSGSREDDKDPREAPQVKTGTCERRNRILLKKCKKKAARRFLCYSDKMPDPCSCNPCQKCPSGSKAFKRSKSRYSGFKCLRFSACPTSKGNEMETGVSEMNTVELVATIAKNATKLIAEKIITAMQSILGKEGDDK